jgi:hypothetical protein
VTNYTVEQWQADIKKEYGWDLIVMSREEIISILQVPGSLLDLSGCGFYFLLEAIRTGIQGIKFPDMALRIPCSVCREMPLSL